MQDLPYLITKSLKMVDGTCIARTYRFCISTVLYSNWPRDLSPRAEKVQREKKEMCDRRGGRKEGREL